MDKREVKDNITFYTVFKTIWGWTLFLTFSAILVVFIPIILFISIFDKGKVVFSYSIKVVYWVFYFFNFPQNTKYIKNGIKRPKKGERRIYVVNHASLYDVIIMQILPGAVKSVMKEAYLKLPLIGWIAKASGNAILKKEMSPGDHIAMYMKIVENLERGSALIIYPEGTKSRSSIPGKFYPGTFKIGRDTEADLVPVIFDTWNVIRPGALWIRDVNFPIVLLPKISYDEYKDFKVKEVADLFKMIMTKNLIELRDKRRENEKRYYRNNSKYIELDNEMRVTLAEFEEKHKENTSLMDLYKRY